MSTHKYFDRICAGAMAVCLLITVLFLNGEALGLQVANRSLGYEDRLMDPDRVHTIDIVMDGWDEFIEDCEDEEYAACAVVVDGEAWRNVAIRAKGNTSLSSVSSMNSQRYSFKIEFDHYNQAESYYGLDKLCLNNIIQDNTLMKDFLTYRMMEEFGADAPLCSYVFVTVNGEDWGLYLAVEGVEDSFLRRNYGGDIGDLYKPDSLNMGGGRGFGRDFRMSEFFKEEEETEESGTTATTQYASTTQSDSTTQSAAMTPPDNGSFPDNFPGSGSTDGDTTDSNSTDSGFPSMPFGNFPGGGSTDGDSTESGFPSMPFGNFPGGGSTDGDATDGNSTESGFPSMPFGNFPGGDAADGDSSNPFSGGFPGMPGMGNSSGEGGFPGGGPGGGGPGGGFGGFGMGSEDVKLRYIDDDPESYSSLFESAKTDVTQADKVRLIAALKGLQSLSVAEDDSTDSTDSADGDSSADSAAAAVSAEDVLNVDEVLRYFVVHNFVVNGDSYTGSMIHNYYLRENDGKFSMIPWDYNLAFGSFQGNNASGAVNDPIDTPLSVGSGDSRPMADWIFADETYTELYHQYFAEFLDMFDLQTMIDETAERIAPYVERDPTKFCTMEEFETGVAALKTFCALRVESVRGQLEGTIPSTDEGQSADSSALIDTGDLNTSDMGGMNQGRGGGMGGPGGGFPGGMGGPGSSGSSDGSDSSRGGFPGGMGGRHRSRSSSDSTSDSGSTDSSNGSDGSDSTESPDSSASSDSTETPGGSDGSDSTEKPDSTNSPGGGFPDGLEIPDGGFPDSMDNFSGGFPGFPGNS